MTPTTLLENAMKNIKPIPIVRSADDEFLDFLRTECAKSIAEYLKAALNTDRPIISLSRHEMLGMAEAATGTWIHLVSARILAEGDKADKAYVALLYGG